MIFKIFLSFTFLFTLPIGAEENKSLDYHCKGNHGIDKRRSREYKTCIQNKLLLLKSKESEEPDEKFKKTIFQFIHPYCDSQFMANHHSTGANSFFNRCIERESRNLLKLIHIKSQKKTKQGTSSSKNEDEMEDRSSQ